MSEELIRENGMLRAALTEIGGETTDPVVMRRVRAALGAALGAAPAATGTESVAKAIGEVFDQVRAAERIPRAAPSHAPHAEAPKTVIEMCDNGHRHARMCEPETYQGCPVCLREGLNLAREGAPHAETLADTTDIGRNQHDDHDRPRPLPGVRHDSEPSGLLRGNSGVPRSTGAVPSVRARVPHCGDAEAGPGSDQGAAGDAAELTPAPHAEAVAITDAMIDAAIRTTLSEADQDLVEYMKAKYPQTYEERAAPVRKAIIAALGAAGRTA